MPTTITSLSAPERRFLILKALYDATADRVIFPVSYRETIDKLGVDPSFADASLYHLIHAGLIEAINLLDGVRLTPAGLNAVEVAIQNPNTATEHFPPVVNVIQVQTMIDSQIQQHSTGAQQTMTTTAVDLEDLKNVIQEIKVGLEKWSLSEQKKSEASGDMAAIESQLTREQPNSIVIRESLKSLRSILEGAAGGVLLAKIMSLIAAFS